MPDTKKFLLLTPSSVLIDICLVLCLNRLSFSPQCALVGSHVGLGRIYEVKYEDTDSYNIGKGKRCIYRLPGSLGLILNHNLYFKPGGLISNK
jgi:hypothetical protein